MTPSKTNYSKDFAERFPMYLDEARSDAADMATEFIDQIVSQLLDGEASTDLLNDYAGADSYHHETHVDKSYDLEDAAVLLRELCKYEETDKGLWEGLEPRDAVCAQAAYTYGNAVYQLWQKLIERINEDFSALSIDIDTRESEAEEHRTRMEEIESWDDQDEDDRAELAELETTKEADTEEAVEKWKTEQTRAMVELTIEGWK
jgi:trans-aconitate methyltransferase